MAPDDAYIESVKHFRFRYKSKTSASLFRLCKKNSGKTVGEERNGIQGEQHMLDVCRKTSSALIKFTDRHWSG